MYKKNAKWLILGILIVILLIMINSSMSKYAETVNLQISLNIIKPTYTVKFHPNNGGADDYTTQSFTYGTAQNLTSNSFTKEGCSFKEWNTEADGSGTSYTDGIEVNNLTQENEDTVDLYAIWVLSGSYRVIHKKMDLDGVNYTIEEEYELQAEPGQQVTPVPKYYEGFISPDAQTTTVAADGSTTIIYLYDRKQYHVSIVDEELLTISNGITSGYYYYGQPIHIEFTPDVPGVTFHFDDYLITTIDEDNVRSSKTMLQDTIDITLNNHIIIEPEYSSYPIGYFKAFNGTPWLDGQYASNHNDVYQKLYTNTSSQTGNGPLRDPSNTAYDEYMFGDMDNPTNGLSKKGITQFKRNTTRSIDEIEELYRAGDTSIKLVSNQVDDGYLSPIEVYAWIDGTTMYWDSRAYIVKFHPDTISPFYCMYDATLIDLTNLNTSLIESFYSFFNTCLKLTEIKGYINTSGVVNPGDSDTYNYAGNTNTDDCSMNGMAYMFNDCKALLSIDVSKFNTSNVVDMKRMFAGCNSLTSLDLFSFDTSNVKSMFWMFRRCRALTEVRLTSFNTTNVTNTFGMFVDDNNLQTIYLGNNFQTPSLFNCSNMFNGCSKLETIYAMNDFDRSHVTAHANMFTGCTKLVGGADTDYETVFNSSIIDKRYAQIANEDHPGYFTLNVKGTKYYITYALDGGSADNRSHYYKTSPTFSLSRPTKEGYRFIGWTGSNGDEPQLDVVIEQGTTGDKNYVAHYEPITYTVVFDANGGTGTMASQPFTYGVSNTLTPNTYTKEDCTFRGWNTSPNGSGTRYADEASVSNLTNVDGGTVILYAQWTEGEDYWVTFLYGSESFSGNNYINTGISLFSTDNINKDFEVSCNVSNFTFLSGQSDNRNLIISEQNEAADPYQGFALGYRDGSIKVQANSSIRGEYSENWGKTSGNVKFNRQDTILYRDGIEIIDYNNIAGPFDAPLSFAANLSASGQARRFAKVDLANMTIKIKYTAEEVAELFSNLPIPEKTGNTFLGWFTQAEGGTKVTPSTPITSTNIVLYSHWTEGGTYTIAFNANGGTGTMPNQTIPSTVSTPLNPNAFTREGYRFVGWNTTANGSGTAYTDEQELYDLSSLTLYAQWISIPRNEYTYAGNITFTGNTSQIIDTGVYLFSNDNIHKNFEMYFEIVSIDSTSGQNTLMNTKDESGSPYPGIVFRIDKSKLQLKADSNSSVTKTVTNELNAVQKVRIIRINDITYYSINDSDYQQLVDFTNITRKFEAPVAFGGLIRPNASRDRTFRGTLANMYVGFISDDATLADYQNALP